MIHTVDNFSVAGAHGMKIAGMDFDVSTIDQPASLTVTFVDENNHFVEPTLSYSNSSLVRIGGISLNMYPVAFTRNSESNGESSVQVKYIDGSFILDQYFVGLKTKHHEYRGTRHIQNNGLAAGALNWDANPTTPFGSVHKNAIILGDYTDPCRDLETLFVEDPCIPCSNEGSTQEEIDARRFDCNKKRNLQIFDVQYSFRDLLQGMTSKGITYSIQADFDERYKRSYWGPLRDVLKSWCSDFGISFIYSPSGNGYIYFYDLSSGVAINNGGLDTSCRTKNFNVTKSIQHTFSRGMIAHYGQAGYFKDFRCNSNYGTLLNCRPLTLLDLVGKQSWGQGTVLYDQLQNQAGSFKVMEMTCLLSSYSPIVRNAVVWFDLYGIKTARDAQAKVTSASNTSNIPGLGITSGGYDPADDGTSKTSLPLLRKTIKSVVAQNATTMEESDSNFRLVHSELSEVVQKAVKDFNKDGYSCYFFVARQYEETLRNLIEWESTIGQDFLGKYFIRKFSSLKNGAPNFTCGGSDSAKYYKQGTDAIDFGHLYSYPNSSSYVDELSKANGQASDNFVLISRGANPVPSRGQSDEMKELIEACEKFYPRPIGRLLDLLPNGKSSLFKNVGSNGSSVNSAEWTEHDVLYFAVEATGLNTSSMNYSDHPLEESFYTQPAGFQTPIRLGLRSTQSRVFSVANTWFWFPPLACVGQSGGYVTSYSTADDTTQGSSLIPKSEAVSVNIPPVNNVASLQVNFKEFGNDTLFDYYKDSNLASCVPNTTVIKSKMDDYCEQMAVKNDQEHREENYEIDGLPEENHTVLQGLSSLSVRVGGEGVSSFLKFSDFMENRVEKSETFQEYQYIEKQGPFLSFNRAANAIPMPNATNPQVT